MNVFGAWKKGFTGRGIVVTILDDGIEHLHPDLALNYVCGKLLIAVTEENSAELSLFI